MTTLVRGDALTQFNDRKDNVATYAKFGIVGTSSLAFREVPELIQKYAKGLDGIDYGCGAGRSSRFLKTIQLDGTPLNPTGVDISQTMLGQAKELDPTGKYELIESGKIPVADKTQKFIFSSFVFLVLSKEQMPVVLKGMKDALADDGVVIISTNSEETHSTEMDWVTYDTNFPENKELSSGSVAKLGIKATGSVFDDYNWLDADYRKFFEESGFKVAETLNPLGKPEDAAKWKSELKHSPCTVYVLQKA